MLARILLGLAAAFTASAALAAGPAVLPDDISIGNPKAPVQVIEYASMACPHCGHFNEAVFAPFKAKYLDTGKAYWTMKEMLTAPETVAAAGFLTARCAGRDKYFKVVDEVFRSQSRWQEGSIKPIFLEIAKANGLTEEKFEACLTDPAALKALNDRVERAVEKDGIESTPTLFINGHKVEGTPQSLEDMEKAIATASKAPAAPAAKKKKGG